MAIGISALPILVLVSLAVRWPTVVDAQRRITPEQDPNNMINSPNFKPNEESSWKELFNNWKMMVGKVYPNTAAEQKGYEMFKQSGMRVMSHNEKHRTGLHTYRLGFNKYSDLSRTDFERMRLGLKPPSWWTPAPVSTTTSTTPRMTPSTASSTVMSQSTTTTATRPTSTAVNQATLNYTAQGCVAPVKDQEVCGSCWAFGSTGAIESAYCKKMGKLVPLSEEQLVDCVMGSSLGCNGGWPMDVYSYVMTQGGYASEMSYPYTAGTTGNAMTCRMNKTNYVTMQLSYTELPANDAALMNALISTGPVSVGVAVGNGFEAYRSGIMDPTTACISSVNHVVLLVGYGVDQQTGLAYWLCKNSWGTSWGEHGYFRLNRNVTNSCQITTLAASVVVSSGKSNIVSAATTTAYKPCRIVLLLSALFAVSQSFMYAGSRRQG